LKRAAVLAPGYGGTAEQPILRKLGSALDGFGIASQALTFTTRGSRPSKEYASEIQDLRAARDSLRAAGYERIALVGRSFGGRISAFLAEREPPDALVILGHPIAPPKRPRPRDEATLAATTCPTLVVQGEKDELGPFAVLERIAANNPRIDLVRIAGAGHDFGAGEAEAVSAAARWLDSVLR
jgi:predicted alpha/beta-hydrolase family hydrolase